jgi:hypothetical protein
MDRPRAFDERASSQPPLRNLTTPDNTGGALRPRQRARSAVGRGVLLCWLSRICPSQVTD